MRLLRRPARHRPPPEVGRGVVYIAGEPFVKYWKRRDTPPGARTQYALLIYRPADLPADGTDDIPARSSPLLGTSPAGHAES